MKSVHETIRQAERNYLQGSTRLGKYVTWNMHDTIEKIDAYLNSKHTTGEVDSLNREKPFFNIVTAATNIWYRATEIDRKDIRFTSTKSSTVVLAFVANVKLQNWMREQRFGHFLKQWGRALARYGSAICKFVEKDGDLIASVVPWNRYIADAVQFNSLPHIEKFYMTPAQLRQNKVYDQQVVDSLITKMQSRKTLDKMQQDNFSDFIELYEVHGELDSRLLKETPDEKVPDTEIKYVQQMHIVSYLKGENKDEYNDFTLYRARESKDPYMITHLIEEDGRTLAIGAVEYLFDAQWMQNHTVKNMKDTLDLASRLIFQTADTGFVGRNVLSAIETGDVLIHSPNNPLTRLANDKPDISALENFGTMWQTLAQEITSTPEALRGITPPSGTPWSTTAKLTQNANSLFEVMTESKGLAIEDMMRDHVIPHLRKQLKHKEEIAGILDNAGITEIDSAYIPFEAIRRFNKNAKETILSGGIPSPFNQQGAEQELKGEVGKLGNKRYFVPDDVDDKTWADVFSDFEWDSIRVDVTNEQQDKQQVLTTLSTVLQTIASNPLILYNPSAKLTFNKILALTGEVSPLELTTEQGQPPLPPRSVRSTIAFKDLPPEGQQQLAAEAGIQLQPPQPSPMQPAPSLVGQGGGGLPVQQK